MNLISKDKRLALKAAFEAGMGAEAAGRAIGASTPTAARYFRIFGWDGKRRKSTAPRRFSGVPRYTGPDWIGKAITPPSDPPAGQPAID